ncbi:MAG: tRNA (adenosine(37)-N6)-threonylcarbamoyltransferase complex transferase subunit TsaD [bacterium]|nr:tRNA (adenosine(37)-N6)-threonylcarbamoyltransferase complex transferase subunit TsaD [bacterium]
MKILAIETSCDETGIALIESDKKNGIQVLANLVSSQIETHRPFGGVVPFLAKREHEKNLPLLWQQLQRIPSLRSYAQDTFSDLDIIAVTQGPGLAPCLWTGVNFAQKIAQELNKPLVGINHLKGHIYIALLEQQISNYQFLISKQNLNHKSQTKTTLKSKFPVLSLIVSGGHTQLVFSKKLGHYQVIGETLDDAAGEAFDKVAKLLKLPYPGGPEISKLATKGNPSRFDFPRPMLNSKNFDFSFSGLKTSVLYLVNGVPLKGGPPLKDRPSVLRLTQKTKADVAASFEQAVVDVLVSKTLRAAKEFKPKTLVLGGGVAANKKLRETLELKFKIDFPNIACLLSPIAMTGDNALMIALAALAERKLLKPVKDLKAEANLRLDS